MDVSMIINPIHLSLHNYPIWTYLSLRKEGEKWIWDPQGSIDEEQVVDLGSQWNCRWKVRVDLGSRWIFRQYDTQIYDFIWSWIQILVICFQNLTLWFNMSDVKFYLQHISATVPRLLENKKKTDVGLDLTPPLPLTQSYSGRLIKRTIRFHILLFMK